MNTANRVAMARIVIERDEAREHVREFRAALAMRDTRIDVLEYALRQNGVPSPRPWYQTGGNKVDMNAVDGTDYAIMTARIAELEGERDSYRDRFNSMTPAFEVDMLLARIAELEDALRGLLDGELSARTIGIARRALGEEA